MELWIHRWGSAAGAPRPASTGREKLIFLHGMGGTGAIWRPVAASLEERFEILAPDQRGHGRSLVPGIPGGGASPGYKPLDYGGDVVQTVETHRFFPAWLIGHSMGVRTACAAAHLRPDLFRGLVLVDLGFSGPTGGGLGQGLADFLERFPMEFPGRAEARAYLTQYCPDPSIAQYLMAVSVPSQRGGLTFPFDRAALIETTRAARITSMGPWVRELSSKGLPILVLRGAHSLVWGKEDFEAERQAFQGIPGLVFEEVADAGHGLPFEKREEFAERIERFIKEHAS